ncbi:protein obstructor-E-like [Artemia franciscana]|uniref:Chitin-binding type-2 domain-containing protein n=1 Tax=Artemia franciscana TaxID=6661 RepID=A0AA88L7L1_ARTSF|nr:hypothetical protein QYM36_005388 [Artemia franciscana]
MKSYCAFLVAVVATASAQSFTCPEPNGYFPDSKQCDKYYTCIDGVATEELCLDGLLFNDNAVWTRNPCDYPIDVDCGSRTVTQPPQSTELCPHAWGIYFTGDKANCGTFRNCVGGVAHDFNCPEGLAFNEQSLRCDWPEQTESCDAAAFIGFTCPPIEEGDLLAAGGHTRFPNPKDCKKFFVCEGGVNVRLAACEEGMVYNPEANDCTEPELVPGCENYYPLSSE